MMTMEVLQAESQISRARQELISRGVSFTESRLRSMMRRWGFVRGTAVGDTVKSWDVLSTLNFIGQHVKQSDPILDIGCYASEVIVALHQLGYSNLTGVDLDPNLRKMPYADSIQYEIGDFMQTRFDNASFRAITSISVIEHGFDGEALAKEVARLLKPGGHFIASFDYWTEKISTDGIKLFDMSWTIFSRQEVEQFIAVAKRHGLSPSGPLDFGTSEKPISCFGRDYTFAWLVLQKSE